MFIVHVSTITKVKLHLHYFPNRFHGNRIIGTHQTHFLPSHIFGIGASCHWGEISRRAGCLRLGIDTTREAKMSSSPSKQVDCFTIPLYMEMVMVEVFAPRHQTAKPFSNLIDLFSVFVSSISNNRSHYIHLRHNSNFSYHNLSNWMMEAWKACQSYLKLGSQGFWSKQQHSPKICD